jgi:hypothetical protein
MVIFVRARLDLLWMIEFYFVWVRGILFFLRAIKSFSHIHPMQLLDFSKQKEKLDERVEGQKCEK